MPLTIATDLPLGGAIIADSVRRIVFGSDGKITIPGDVTMSAGLLRLSKRPIFSAYLNANQTLTSATITKVTLNAKDFDVTNAFNVTTGRFQPDVAGIYQINCVVTASTTSGAANGAQAHVNKNGSMYRRFTYQDNTTNAINSAGVGGGTLVQMNGTSDYLELTAYCSVAAFASGGQTATWMNGFLVEPSA